MHIINPYRFASAETDPNFADVTLLLLMDGADESQTFTDSSADARTITAGGNFKQDDAVLIFTTETNGLSDGTGDYLTTPYSTTDFNWWDDDFTVELWVYAASFADWASPSGDSAAIGNMSVTTSTNYWSFGPIADGKIRFYYFNGSSIRLSSTGSLPTDQWVHIAMSHTVSDGAIKLFIDGTEDGGGTKSGTPQSSAGVTLSIGQSNNASVTGRMSNVRITKGTARYTGSFTPPSAPFPTS